MFTSEVIRALVMALIAGMSTLLGMLVVLFRSKQYEKLLSISLGFAAGVMISVSFTDLLPQAETALCNFGGNKLGLIMTVAFLIIGVMLAGSLDKLVPHDNPDEVGKEHKDLFRVGFVSMLAIGLHNFPEGIATFMAGYDNLDLGTSVTLAIALHNIPEGLSVAMPIYFATGSKIKAFKYTFLSGFAEPLGAIIAFLFLRPFINDLSMGGIFALVSGLMLYIAIEELIPSSRQYGYTKQALIATFAGICLMPLSNII